MSEDQRKGAQLRKDAQIAEGQIQDVREKTQDRHRLSDVQVSVLFGLHELSVLPRCNLFNLSEQFIF